MTLTPDPREWLRPALDGHWPLEALFDTQPNLLFFVKDLQGRYVSVNGTLARRSGATHKAELLGRTAAEVFTGETGAQSSAQDERVLRGGRDLRDLLELYFDAQGRAVWCLTVKLPLRDDMGRVVGLVGLCTDLPPVGEAQSGEGPRSATGQGDYARVAQALAHMQEDYAQSLRVAEVAAGVGLSADRFERLVRRVCGVTPKQFLLRVRFDAAVELLRQGTLGISAVAHACGYSDHSAFSRQFRAMTGLSPQAYRQRMGRRHELRLTGGQTTGDS